MTKEKIIRRPGELYIGIDIDETISDFVGPFENIFGKGSIHDVDVKNKIWALRRNKEFWLDLPLLETPEFTPFCYYHKRPCPDYWTKQWITDNHLPLRYLYEYTRPNLVRQIGPHVDFLIDDSISNFEYQNNELGIKTLLISNNENANYNTPLRIYNLTKAEINRVIEPCFNLHLK